MHSQLLSHCETLDFIARDLLPSICLKMQIVTVDEPHNVVLLHCWSILFHTVYDISFKSWHLGLHDVSNEHMRICRISQSTKDMLQEILMILTLFCFKFIRVCTSNYFHIKRFDKSYSSSSSTQGQRGRSVHSPRGPILSAVEGVSSGQTTEGWRLKCRQKLSSGGGCQPTRHEQLLKLWMTSCTFFRSVQSNEAINLIDRPLTSDVCKGEFTADSLSALYITT